MNVGFGCVIQLTLFSFLMNLNMPSHQIIDSTQLKQMVVGLYKEKMVIYFSF